MSNKLLCVLLLILFIILIIMFLSKKDEIESFASNEWTTNRDVLAAEKASLNDVQKEEVKNMITSISQSQLKTLISTQSPLLTGPAGPPGIQGPPGSVLVASGRLVNKTGSFDPTSDKNTSFIPKYVVSRTEGTNPTSSLTFMDNLSPFVSFQNWNLDVNNNIKNRYDGNCLTMSETQEKIFMDKCSDNANQKWSWDSSNRIISTTASNSTKLKCIGLTKPEQNVLTTNVPGCSGRDCMTNTLRRYLTVKDCDVNNINEDEIWSFI